MEFDGTLICDGVALVFRAAIDDYQCPVHPGHLPRRHLLVVNLSADSALTHLDG